MLLNIVFNSTYCNINPNQFSSSLIKWCKPKCCLFINVNKTINIYDAYKTLTEVLNLLIAYKEFSSFVRWYSYYIANGRLHKCFYFIIALIINYKLYIFKHYLITAMQFFTLLLKCSHIFNNGMA